VTTKIAILGCGTVGRQVLLQIHAHLSRLAALGRPVEVTGVLVRDPSRPRGLGALEGLLTADASALGEADLYIEVMGGTVRPLELLAPAIAAGKPLITANKALLAERWDALLPLAERGLLRYEASVMAATPVIAPLAQLGRSAGPTSLEAVLNGTCSYILSRMERGVSYRTALAEAQSLGYAEDPPTLDVDGWDAAHKLTVLGRLLFDPGFSLDRVAVQGIGDLHPEDLAAADRAGQALRLVAEISFEGGWRGRVWPKRLPKDHPLAWTPLSRNALLFSGTDGGTWLLSGPGAGGAATASAILGDLFSWAQGIPGPRPLGWVAAPPPEPS
jgi:homoserine dehydrogenase